MDVDELKRFVGSVPNRVMWIDCATFDEIMASIPPTWRYMSLTQPGPNLMVGPKVLIRASGNSTD